MIRSKYHLLLPSHGPRSGVLHFYQIFWEKKHFTKFKVLEREHELGRKR